MYPSARSLRLALGSALALLLLLPAALGAATATKRPNFVIILADDLGYGDVQCYNPARGKIPTPHLDRLAAQGMRFTDGHSSSGVCSPSRYTLLTGRYHWRTRLQTGIVDLWEHPLIAPDRLTLAGLAQAQGYVTAAFGKWHLGWDWPITAEQRPLVRGLGGRQGRAQGTLITQPTPAQREAWAAIFAQRIRGGPTTRGFERYFGTDVPNWPPYAFIDNDRTVGIPTELLPAREFDGFRGSLQGPALPGWRFEEILGTLADRASAYIRERAARTEPFLIYLPLTTPHTPIVPSAKWQGRSGLNDYADLVMETDDAVGRVLAALDHAGVAPNTLVLFSSDNGYEAGIGVKPLEAMGHFPSGPLRGYKRDVHEGGHRVPFVVRWPGVVKAGTVCDQLVHHADVLATLADVLGATLPANAGEDSFSFLSLLRGGTAPIRPHAVSCAASGMPGVRSGQWKLIYPATAAAGAGFELYDLAADLGETRNLAAEHPARVAELKALYEQLLARGRSTPGPTQANDVEVRRFPQPASAGMKAAKKQSED